MSVVANIVEGSAHTSPREFARFLSYAIASVSESEGHAQLGCDMGMISHRDLDLLLQRIIDVRMMLHGLRKKLQSES